MLDTMTLTKLVGGFCGALLVFLLGQWAAEAVYHTGEGAHGESVEQAYIIDTGEDESASGEGSEEQQVPFLQLVAEADPDHGESLFRACSACHVVDSEKNGVGPHLSGVMGRQMASLDNYQYDDALPTDEKWTPKKLSKWIENPQKFAPGTKMGYAGMPDREDRADVIAYLAEFTKGYTLPEPEPQEEASASSEGGGSGGQAASAQNGGSEGGGSSGGGSGGGSEFQTALAKADPSAGEKTFRACQACHVVDKEQNRVGPYLKNVVGRKIASVESFSYSDALPDGKWTPERLNEWLTDPQEYAPGTKMTYAGLKDVQDRANVIAYLAENTEGYDLSAATGGGSGGSGDKGAGKDGTGGQNGEQGASGAADGNAAAQQEDASEGAAAKQNAGDGEAGDSGADQGETAGADAASGNGGSADGGEAAEDGSGSGQSNAGQSNAGDQGQDGAPAQKSEAGKEASSAEGGQPSPIEAAYEKADIDAGEKTFRQCQACHVADGKQNRVGPYLLGVHGRKIGSVESYDYSDALPDGKWTLAKLDEWLKDPQGYAPGTKMTFAGLSDVQDRANVIAYIDSFSQ